MGKIAKKARYGRFNAGRGIIAVRSCEYADALDGGCSVGYTLAREGG